MRSVNDPPTRLYYLDWLRVLAMLGVFFYHNARFFDELSDWHVKNSTTNLAATVYVAFAGQWGMPLFFILAGAGTYFALRNVRMWQYVQERTLRLVVPLIFGMIVVVAPQAYFEAIYKGAVVEGNFFQIYWTYLKTIPDLNWYHLWFLAYLFIISVAAVIIFIPLGKDRKSIISRLVRVLDKPWILLIVVVVILTIVDAYVYPAGFWGNKDTGGWAVPGHAVFFLSGYIVFASNRIPETIRKYGWIGVISGGIAATCMLLFLFEELSHPTEYFGTGKYLLAQFTQAVNTWSWVMAILCLGSRYLTGTNRFLKYSNEAVLPFYIFHQTVIIVIGFYVIQWNVSILVKYLIISSLSFATIMTLYEIVKRFNVLRILFGMRTKRNVPDALELPKFAA